MRTPQARHQRQPAPPPVALSKGPVALSPLQTASPAATMATVPRPGSAARVYVVLRWASASLPLYSATPNPIRFAVAAASPSGMTACVDKTVHPRALLVNVKSLPPFATLRKTAEYPPPAALDYYFQDSPAPGRTRQRFQAPAGRFPTTARISTMASAGQYARSPHQALLAAVSIPATPLLRNCHTSAVPPSAGLSDPLSL
jgi:hypothetical protein